MKTTTYKDALGIFCELAGFDPETLSDVDNASFNRLFNLWMKRGWEFYFWPQLARIESRDVNAQGVIPFEAPGLDTLDTINAIYPDEDAGTACAVRFKLLSDGARVLVNASERLPAYWVEYRPPCPAWKAGEPDKPIPAFLAPFAAHGAYTTWLRGEGQQGKAMQETGLPWDWLFDEIDKIERQQSQTRRWRFRRN